LNDGAICREEGAIFCRTDIGADKQAYAKWHGSINLLQTSTCRSSTMQSFRLRKDLIHVAISDSTSGLGHSGMTFSAGEQWSQGV